MCFTASERLDGLRGRFIGASSLQFGIVVAPRNLSSQKPPHHAKPSREGSPAYSLPAFSRKLTCSTTSLSFLLMKYLPSLLYRSILLPSFASRTSTHCGCHAPLSEWFRDLSNPPPPLCRAFEALHPCCQSVEPHLRPSLIIRQTLSMHWTDCNTTHDYTHSITNTGLCAFRVSCQHRVIQRVSRVVPNRSPTQ